MLKRVTWCLTAACCVLGCVAFSTSAAGETGGGSPAQPPSEFRLADFSITLERVFHTRACPHYTVIVRGDGTGECVCRETPEGEAHRAQFDVSREALNSLMGTLYREDFFRLSSKYGGKQFISVDSLGTASVQAVKIRANPVSGGVFSVRIREYTKSVAVEAGDRPYVLYDLEHQMDDIALRAYRELAGEGSDSTQDGQPPN